jgi:hypothetical protein
MFWKLPSAWWTRHAYGSRGCHCSAKPGLGFDICHPTVSQVVQSSEKEKNRCFKTGARWKCPAPTPMLLVSKMSEGMSQSEMQRGNPDSHAWNWQKNHFHNEGNMLK